MLPAISSKFVRFSKVHNCQNGLTWVVFMEENADLLIRHFPTADMKLAESFIELYVLREMWANLFCRT